MFTTDAPCPACAELIYIEGITRVFYDRPYRIDTLDWLTTRGIEVYRILANGMISRHQIPNAS
jgi:deoxycytidylate deaminase